jgi:hypothetical protein
MLRYWWLATIVYAVLMYASASRPEGEKGCCLWLAAWVLLTIFYLAYWIAALALGVVNG